MAATTTTLKKVADSIFVQDTDEQIRYAMFKKEEAEIHEAHMRAKLAKLAETEIKLAESETKLAESETKLAESEAIINELQRKIAELEGKSN